MATKKKPSAAQLAARAKFIEMVRAKSKAKKSATKKAATKKSATKKSVTKKVATHKDTKSHNVNIRVVSGVDGFAKTQAGAIYRVHIKRKLKTLGFHVPAETNTNDLVKLYKAITGKSPITITKIKTLLKKGSTPQSIINS